MSISNTKGTNMGWSRNLLVKGVAASALDAQLAAQCGHNLSHSVGFINLRDEIKSGCGTWRVGARE
jgi:hypothetical protein